MGDLQLSPGYLVLQRHLDMVLADRQAIGEVADDVDQAVERANHHLESMLVHMGYLDDPQHVMAVNLFACAALLALYLALKDEGMDVHEFGRRVLTQVKASPSAGASLSVAPALSEAAIDSQTSAKPGEFVFETLEALEGQDFDWGMNIKSCAICALFGKFDAMDLVPYMCASDDVVSDNSDQGLSRTGTIALGAEHCDFRYSAGKPGEHLSDIYPERIRILPE